MPPAGTTIDPEAFLRSAVSAVAVAAHTRGVRIATHVDLRLPARVVAACAGLDRFLGRGLKRTIEVGRISKIALALWLDAQGPDGAMRMLLEVCREFDGAARPAAPLVQLWTLPLGVGRASPQPARDDARVESVVISVDVAPDPPLAAAAAHQCGDRWRGVMRGRRFLDTRDPLYDRDRLQMSIAAIGARIDFAGSIGEALEVLRDGVAGGQPLAAAALGDGPTDLDPVDLARQVRSDPQLAGTRLILTSMPAGRAMPEDSAALFDVMLLGSGPRRRILDVIYDLLRVGESLPGAASEPVPGGAIPALAGRRILIAEDVATNQMLLQAVLAPTGAAVEVVENGARAIERHATDPADLILMDLQMPGVSGIAALKQIRAMAGARGSVPVLALTACALTADRQKALDAGMDGYLAKPILIEEFYAALRRFVPTAADGG